MNFDFTDYVSYKAYTKDFVTRYNEAIRNIRLYKQAYKNMQRTFEGSEAYKAARAERNRLRLCYGDLYNLQNERAASRVESGKQRTARLEALETA